MDLLCISFCKLFLYMFLSCRFNGCNIRQREDVIIYSEVINTSGIVLTVDFENAFDSINWIYF